MATQGCMEGADFVPENVELRFDWSSFASEIFYEAQDHEVFYGNLEIRAPFKTALESTFFSKSTSESYRTEEGYHTYYGFTPRWIPAVRVESQLRSYSRERIFYVTSLNPVMIGNIGLFRYPIAVRQRGTYGTYYLDEAQIASCIEDPGRWRDTTLIPVGEDQRFVRGRRVVWNIAEGNDCRRRLTAFRYCIHLSTAAPDEGSDNFHRLPAYAP